MTNCNVFVITSSDCGVRVCVCCFASVSETNRCSYTYDLRVEFARALECCECTRIANFADDQAGIGTIDTIGTIGTVPRACQKNICVRKRFLNTIFFFILYVISTIVDRTYLHKYILGIDMITFK